MCNIWSTFIIYLQCMHVIHIEYHRMWLNIIECGQTPILRMPNHPNTRAMIVGQSLEIPQNARMLGQVQYGSCT